METVKLNISRDRSLVGIAMPFRVSVDGNEIDLFKSGEYKTLIIPYKRVVLHVSMLGNKVAFHKIYKEVVLFPQYCNSGIINCLISTKFNPLGLLTMGIFSSVGKIVIDVEYC